MLDAELRRNSLRKVKRTGLGRPHVIPLGAIVLQAQTCKDLADSGVSVVTNASTDPMKCRTSCRVEPHTGRRARCGCGWIECVAWQSIDKNDVAMRLKVR